MMDFIKKCGLLYLLCFFTSAYAATISGQVKFGKGGSGVPQATVNVETMQPTWVDTDNNGFFTINNLQSNKLYRLRASYNDHDGPRMSVATIRPVTNVTLYVQP